LTVTDFLSNKKLLIVNSYLYVRKLWLTVFCGAEPRKSWSFRAIDLSRGIRVFIAEFEVFMKTIYFLQKITLK